MGIPKFAFSSTRVRGLNKMVKMDRKDIEKLIELVRGPRFLYDASCAEYKDAQLVHNVWESISQAMGYDSIKGIDWKKNQRDAYIKKRKELRTTKSGQGPKRLKKWAFYDTLSFLDKYTDFHNTDSNVAPVNTSAGIDGEISGEESDEDEEEELDVSFRSVASTPEPEPEPGPSTSQPPQISFKKSTKGKACKRKYSDTVETSSMEKALTGRHTLQYSYRKEVFSGIVF